MTTETDLDSRTRRLEDRTQISEQVIKYALAVDRRDWTMFGDCFTDHVTARFGDGPPSDLSRDELVTFVSNALDGFDATQHLSPNHVIEFDGGDPDRAICFSYMYAQHLLKGSESGDYYLLRGSYDNHMLRTSGGWRIERLVQHRSWEEGNAGAVAEARR